ncbi:hypothetical protein [Dactylosporangium sp. NPDC051484]|uniref:hypothetical protein n=1 Tax=Dactylosporangium sp. NPDC051484 TaxID=3154942 RepID=UPI00344F3C7E
MVAKKIQPEDEPMVMGWFREGKTYDEMVELFKAARGIEVVPSTFGNFRRRHRIEPRIVRDTVVIPWEVLPEHRYKNAIQMLRRYGRRLAGEPIPDLDTRRLDGWLRSRREDNTVVHYEPDTDDGFFYVERRQGIDLGMVREPEWVLEARERPGLRVE